MGCAPSGATPSTSHRYRPRATRPDEAASNVKMMSHPSLELTTLPPTSSDRTRCSLCGRPPPAATWSLLHRPGDGRLLQVGPVRALGDRRGDGAPKSSIGVGRASPATRIRGETRLAQSGSRGPRAGHRQTSERTFARLPVRRPAKSPAIPPEPGSRSGGRGRHGRDPTARTASSGQGHTARTGRRDATATARVFGWYSASPEDD
jgi:hypothetical protein